MRKVFPIVFFAAIITATAFFFVTRPKPVIETKFVQEVREEASPSGQLREESKKAIPIKSPGTSALVASPRQVYQTFNNCGPATLSMILSWYGVDVSQKELGEKMRPYQNPRGDNDDKTIFPNEFVDWAKRYGLEAISQPNGNIELLKMFLANEIPVVVKTWLRVGEDIGHFRIVRGFDEEKKVIIQDDSYHGPNKKISYFDFLSMWQPFNYTYLLVYPREKEDLVMAILGEERESAVAWRKALVRANKEHELDPENVYPVFNKMTAAYHLGEYQAAVGAFELVEEKLPRRMLWYQIEPILAYQKLERFDRVFEITERILNGGNRAFSELYLIRGESYLSQGKRDEALEEFELALFYKPGYEEAAKALEALHSD